MLDAEVQRINTTTHAPDMLAEIKAALDNDPVKFANVFAKPISQKTYDSLPSDATGAPLLARSSPPAPAAE